MKNLKMPKEETGKDSKILCQARRYLYILYSYCKLIDFYYFFIAHNFSHFRSCAKQSVLYFSKITKALKEANFYVHSHYREIYLL